MRKLLLALATLAVMHCHAATTKQTPVEEFRERTQYQTLMCQIAEKAGEQKQDATFQELAECIKNAKVVAKATFGPALKAVSKNKAATSLMKDYYAAWLTSINGQMPVPDELRADYTQRQQIAQTNYEAIWNRLEVEVGAQ